MAHLRKRLNGAVIPRVELKWRYHDGILRGHTAAAPNVKIEPVLGVLLSEDGIHVDHLTFYRVKRVGVAEGVDLEAATSLLTPQSQAVQNLKEQCGVYACTP